MFLRCFSWIFYFFLNNVIYQKHDINTQSLTQQAFIPSQFLNKLKTEYSKEIPNFW